MDMNMINDLAPELRARLKKELSGCRDAAEAAEILGKNGIQTDRAQAEKVVDFVTKRHELDDEDLDMVSGGCGSSSGRECPACGSTNISSHLAHTAAQDITDYKCNDCGCTWTEC